MVPARPPCSGKVVVVGNAPVLTQGPLQPPIPARRLARFLDEADVVVRMNDLKNRRTWGLGRRTDVLAVMNYSGPAARFANGPRIEDPVLAGLREILFVVPPAEVARRSRQEPEPAGWPDHGPAILAHQGWSALPRRYIRDEVGDGLCAALAGQGATAPFPSTGARVIAHVLADPLYAGCSVHLVGFAFAGWEGHAFDAERRWCEALRADGRVDGVPSPCHARCLARLQTAARWTLSRRARRAFQATHLAGRPQSAHTTWGRSIP